MRQQQFSNHPDDTLNLTKQHEDADTSGYQVTEIEPFEDANVEPDRSDPPVDITSEDNPK